MITLQPNYKCRSCGATTSGKITEYTDRPLSDVLSDVIDRAEPMLEPHNCDSIGKVYGAWEYTGFTILSRS